MQTLLIFFLSFFLSSSFFLVRLFCFLFLCTLPFTCFFSNTRRRRNVEIYILLRSTQSDRLDCSKIGDLGEIHLHVFLIQHKRTRRDQQITHPARNKVQQEIRISTGWTSLEIGDQDQDLDRTNTTTRRGTKIQKSKLKRNIVGHKRVIGQRKQIFQGFLWTMGDEKKRI